MGYNQEEKKKLNILMIDMVRIGYSTIEPTPL